MTIPKGFTPIAQEKNSNDYGKKLKPGKSIILLQVSCGYLNTPGYMLL